MVQILHQAIILGLFKDFKDYKLILGKEIKSKCDDFFARNIPKAVATMTTTASSQSMKRPRILDWAKSWKRYKKRVNNSSSVAGNESNGECQCKRCITRAMNNPEKALNSVSQIDKISRIVFPFAFALLNGFYWFSYLKHSQRIDLSFESAWKTINRTINEMVKNAVMRKDNVFKELWISFEFSHLWQLPEFP